MFADHEDLVIRPRTHRRRRDDLDAVPVPARATASTERLSQEFLAERNVATRMVWTGNILRQPGFADIAHRQPADGLPGTDLVMDRALTLPIHHGLTSDDLGYMVGCLNELFRTL